MPKLILWNSKEAEKATGGKSIISWKAYGVSIDSRKISKGDLFLAIKGDHFDGHNFVKDALAKGAAAAVVDRIPKGIKKDAPLLIVSNVTVALHDLAKYSRSRMNGKIIAVTGSVGKTSTKEMLALAFKGQGGVYYTEGNLNNHYGLPLSLARMPKNTAYGIFEIGMNHAGEISPLSKLAKPDVAIITNIEAVHLEFFDSLQGIADAKSEILDGVAAKGAAIINFDNQFYSYLKNIAKNKKGIKNIISFGSKAGADYQLKQYSEKDSKAEIKSNLEKKVFNYKLGICGKHQAINSLAVLAAVRFVGADIKKAGHNLTKCQAKPGRGKISKIRIGKKNITVIDDCYNASPASVSAALDKFGSMQVRGRKLAVLGDMFELGSNAPSLHKNISEKIIANNINQLFVAGNLMLNLYKAVPESIRGGHAVDSTSLASLLKKALQDGDVLLVKGSRGMKMENVIKILGVK